MTAFLRLLKPGTAKLPAGHTEPDWEAFLPSTDDKEDAKKNSHPIRVSVWSREKTTIPQAREIMGLDATARAFAITDDTVARIAAATKRPELRIVPDPRPELKGRPGGDGHCGIEGCERPAGEQKTLWKDRLLVLARCCRDVTDEPEPQS